MVTYLTGLLTANNLQARLEQQQLLLFQERSFLSARFLPGLIPLVWSTQSLRETQLDHLRKSHPLRIRARAAEGEPTDRGRGGTMVVLDAAARGAVRSLARKIGGLAGGIFADPLGVIRLAWEEDSVNAAVELPSTAAFWLTQYRIDGPRAAPAAPLWWEAAHWYEEYSRRLTVQDRPPR